MFKDKFFTGFISNARNGFGKKYIANNANNNLQNSELAEKISELCSECKNPRIYIDTCTLLHQYGMALLEAVERVLPEYHLELMIPASVLYELENVGNKDSSQRVQSQKMLEKITSMEQNGSVRIVLTNSPTFSDAGFISRFVSECQSFDLILLTQDKQLAKKAKQLPSFLDGCIQTTHEIKTYKLTSYGSLEENDESHVIERKVINYGNSEIYSKPLSYPHFYSHA